MNGAKFLGAPSISLTQRKGQKKNDDIGVEIGAEAGYSSLGVPEGGASSVCVTILGVILFLLFVIAIIVGGIALHKLLHGFATPWIIADNITAKNALNGTDATITLIRAGEIWVNDLHGNRSVFVNSTTQNLWATDIYTVRLNSTNISATLIWTDSIHGNTATFVNVTAVSIWANDIHTNILTANNVTTNTLAANDIWTNTIHGNSANFTELSATTIWSQDIHATTVQATNVTAENTWTDKIHGNSANFTEIEARTLAVENLTVVNQLSLPCPEGGRVLEVGSGKPYPTIKSALDTFNQLRVCPETTIKLSPGNYVNDPIEINRGSSGGTLYPDKLKNTVGLHIVGDERAIVAHSFSHGQFLMSEGRSGLWNVSTDQPGVGPFYSAIAPVWSENPTPFEVTGEVVIADPLDACTPLVNAGAVAGKIVLMKRGICGFNTKATNAGLAGAAHVIIFNTAGPPFPGNLGTAKPASQQGAFVYLSFDDGEAIRQAALLGTTQVTLHLDNIYAPAIGSPRADVTLSHPGGDLSKIRVDLSNAPFVLEQPNFVLGGIVPGDKIMVVHRTVGPYTGFGVDDAATYERTIASVAPQEITLTQPLQSFLNSSVYGGSSFTFLPNVRVEQYLSGGVTKPAMSIDQASLLVSGVFFDRNPAAAFGQGTCIVSMYNSAVNINRIVVANPDYRAIEAIIAHNSDITSNLDSTEGRAGDVNAFIGSLELINSKIVMRHLFSAAGYNYGVILIGSYANLVDVIINWAGMALGNLRCAITAFDSAVSIDGLSAFAQNPNGDIVIDYSSILKVTAPMDIAKGGQLALFGEPTPAIQVTGGSLANIYAPVTIRDHFLGEIIVGGRSNLELGKGSNLTISGPEPSRGVVVADSSGSYVELTTDVVNNIYRTAASGAVKSAYATHIMTGTEQTLSLDPAATVDVYVDEIPRTLSLFADRKYTIVNMGINNTIILDSGAFYGADVTVPGTNNVYSFPNTPGHCITLHVISPTEVLVCSGGNVGSWSSLVKKAAPAAPAKKTAPAGFSKKAAPGEFMGGMNHSPIAYGPVA